MAQTMITIRMDENIKKGMEKACAEMGLSMTAAFTVFAKTVIRERRIPFEISADPFYSQSNMNALAESRKQIKDGHVVIKTMDELRNMENE